MATRARLPLILSRSIRILWLMKRKVGTSLKIRSYVGLSRTTACCALSLTFPFDHFFFFADLPPPDDGAEALALAWGEGKRQRHPTHIQCIHPRKDAKGHRWVLH